MSPPLPPHGQGVHPGGPNPPNAPRAPAVVKVPILARLEALRDEELDERREKRRRQAAEDEAKDAERGPEDKDRPEAQTPPRDPSNSPLAPPQPPEHEEGGPGRPPQDAEATQMELSPAPTITSLSPERAEDSDALTAVSSQLEGSPMDTSSLASCTLEESGGAPPAPTAPQNPPGTPQGPPPAPPDAAQPPDDSSPPASSSESSSTRDSAGAISGADSRGILEEPLPSTSSEEEDPLAGISLPEGVDPSFLAALPDDIRREVLQNQLGIRPPARAPPAASPAPPVVATPGLTEVSPEFLAALPPAIQEEVLAQQRAEQQRRELAQATGSDAPMDPVTFIQTLPSELRRSVLEDMEDSVLAVMPPDIAAEAQALRREQEARQRQLMHERLFGHSSTSALSAILRSPAFTSRLSGNRGVQYTRLAVQRGGTFHMGGTGTHSRPAGSSVDSLLRLRGRLLLDHEALSCLLVLLFVDEPKLNTSRLHRVLRNLCYHAPTRGLGGAEPAVHPAAQQRERALPRDPPRDPRPGRRGAAEERPGWSSHRARLGRGARAGWTCCTPRGVQELGAAVLALRVHRTPPWAAAPTSSRSSACPAASTREARGGRRLRRPHPPPGRPRGVAGTVLDTLIQLAKVFPSHFTQQRGRDPATDPERDRGPPKSGGSPCPPPTPPNPTGSPSPSPPSGAPSPANPLPSRAACPPISGTCWSSWTT
ncbi:E3 ubiquitin-protein ligase HUWE1-like [Cyanocitta cristata]